FHERFVAPWAAQTGVAGSSSLKHSRAAEQPDEQNQEKRCSQQGGNDGPPGFSDQFIDGWEAERANYVQDQQEQPEVGEQAAHAGHQYPEDPPILDADGRGELGDGQQPASPIGLSRRRFQRRRVAEDAATAEGAVAANQRQAAAALRAEQAG